MLTLTLVQYGGKRLCHACSGAVISSFIEFYFLHNQEQSVTAFMGLFVNCRTLMCSSYESILAVIHASQSKEHHY